MTEQPPPYYKGPFVGPFICAACGYAHTERDCVVGAVGPDGGGWFCRDGEACQRRYEAAWR